MKLGPKRWIRFCFYVGISSSLMISAIGCGGGGGSAAVSNVQELSAGPLRVQGQLKSPTVDGVPGGLSVYSFSGAITKAYWTDANPTLAETEIVFCTTTASQGVQILACEPDGSNVRVVASLANYPYQLCVTDDGAWLYFTAGDVLKRVPMSGGSVTTLLSDVRTFALTPSGGRILAYRPVADTIVVANADGTDVSVRLTPAESVNPVIVGCLNENYGLFMNDYGSPNPIGVRLSLSGPLTRSYPFGFTGIQLYDVDMRPNRDRVVCLYRVLSTDKTILNEAFLLSGGASFLTLDLDVPVTKVVYPFASSPDGSRSVAFRYYDEVARLMIVDRYFNTISVPVEGNNMVRDPLAWAPSAKFRTFVGAGNYAGGAAAVLFSDKDQRTPSVVLADCTTRASMTVQRMTDVNDGTLIYRLECDNLTKLHYTKSNNFAQIGVVGSLTGLRGAFVSFDGSTGRVNNVVTYAKRPELKRVPGGWKLEGGEVVDVYDEAGERVAQPGWRVEIGRTLSP